MSIPSEINRLKQNVADSFTAVGNKGGTVPSSKVSDNLASAINSIPTGAELNFEVVGGTTPPSNPKANAIWVNTSTTITSWIFSAEQPSNPVNGMVWISTGTSSRVEFNALKEKSIEVYPISAKQYVDGTWVTKTAQSYQNGEWVDWFDSKIVKDGIAYKQFEIIDKSFSAQQPNDVGNNITVTQQSGHVSVKGSRGGYGAACAKIDLTHASKVILQGTFAAEGTEITSLAVWSRIDGAYVTSNMVASTPLTRTGATLDISNPDITGEMYVGITTVYINDNKIVNMLLE